MKPLSATFVLALLVWSTRAADAPAPVSFRDVEGRAHTPLAQPNSKATVLFFLLPDCPIANAYAPEIKRICTAYQPRKVATFVVHADPDVSAAAARKHA